MDFALARSLVDQALRQFVEQMGEKNRLRDACEYALFNGGKRLRPILVLLIAEALGLGKDVMPAALSVEFFHTASLIADDLPCMDDDDERRDRPSLHKAFGESTAILASYTLIAEGYGGIAKNARNEAENALLCLEAATRCAGIKGATNGQFLDLFPPDASFETVMKIIYQKTATLFEISFIFGWIFGGGDPEKLEKVKACSCHLGSAFQIADDLLDDEEEQNITNISKVCGREKAVLLFEKEVCGFEKELKDLGLWGDSFREIARWLRNYPLKASA